MDHGILFSSGLRARLRASAIHLGISLGIAALAAALVFGIWYPYPYREISGGRELFTILVSVDVVLGPLITLAVFNRAKPWAELRRDLVVVALLQLSALVYGLWTVAVARPVHLVFEYNRFAVVHAVDIAPEMLAKAPPGITALPWTGPTLIALRPFKDGNEQYDATMAALNGMSLPARTDLWQSYAQSRAAILAEAKPVRALQARFADQAQALADTVRAGGGDPQTALYLPLVSRRIAWTVLLDPADAHVLGTFPLDPF